MDLTQELVEHFIPLESICNSILDGVIIADSSKRFLYWNKSAKEILEDIPDSVDPQDWAIRYKLMDIKTEQFLSFETLPLVKAMNGESFHDYRIMIKTSKHPEGKILSVNGNPLRNGMATVGAITTFRDISSEVKLQKKLQNNKEMYERMLDLMPCVVFIKDLKGVYIYGNKCLLDIFNTQSVTGHHCQEYLEENSAKIILKNDGLVVESGKYKILNEEVVLKDGRKIPFRSIRFPYRNEMGEVIGVCAVSEVLSEASPF